MRNLNLPAWIFGMAILAIGATSLHADAYKVDPVHSFALFRVHHFNAGNVWGRFNDPAGEFTLDQVDPSKNTFNVELKLAKLDTANT